MRMPCFVLNNAHQQRMAGALVEDMEESGDAVYIDSAVSEQCLQELLDVFVKNVYKARNVDRRYEIIHKRCIHLIGRDYKIDVIDNKVGQLCGHYPSELVVIEAHLDHSNTSSGVGSSSASVNNAAQLKELITTARFARCRSRFVMPVILFENKNICRSATLSTMAELYGRTGVDWIFTGGEGNPGSLGDQSQSVGSDDKDQSTTSSPPAGGGRGAIAISATPSTETVTGIPGNTQTANGTSEWVLLSKVRGQDVQLLKSLNVSLICDLMVEKKKLKYGVYVCSSEKVDKWARYSDFLIASMPYPGCEFFRDYRDNGYNPVSLKFDWSQTFVDAELSVPDALNGVMQTSHSPYQEWDLVQITQNYLKMLLQYLVECEGGILIHCISGWDRTPLFISLLRLSLWADSKIHQSLSPSEVLYFTLAYDWLVYGHQFKERHEKGEEIMYFCFDFLKYITTDEFAIHQQKSSSKERASSSSRKRGRRTSTDIVFDTANPCSSGRHYELGESWVREDEHKSPSIAYTDLSEVEMNGQDNGPQNVSLDCLNLKCQYSSSAPVKTAAKSDYKSVREQRLNQVRELFLRVYRTSVPEAPEQTGGPLAGFTGFLSRIAGSVINNQTNV